MKITAITVYRVLIPYSGGVYNLSGGRTYTEFDSTIVSVTTDDGWSDGERAVLSARTSLPPMRWESGPDRGDKRLGPGPECTGFRRRPRTDVIGEPVAVYGQP